MLKNINEKGPQNTMIGLESGKSQSTRLIDALNLKTKQTKKACV